MEEPIIKKKEEETAALVTEEEEEEKEEEEKEEEEVDNPLVAKPSLAAQFLFQPQPKSIPMDDILEKAIRKSCSIGVFKFDQPSPDDIVMAAQSQRGSNKKN
jgi:hypothetical protein